MAKKAHTLIAEHLMMDSAEVWQYRYHYGLTRRPIYAMDNAYYATGKTRPTDFTDKDGGGLQWRKVATIGTTHVWEALSQ